MKKFTCLLLLIQSGLIIAQTKTVVTPYGEKVTISPYANNGLSTNNGFIQLGGALTQPSVLTTSPAFTLAINGLQAGSASDNVLVTDATGVLKYVSRASFGGGADNLGNHIATQDLEMSTKSILNIWNAYVKNEVQIKDRLASYTNYFGLYKNNGFFGIWNNLKNTNALTIEENTNNVGIGTTIPTNTLHVKAASNPLRVEGLIASTNSTDEPIVIASDGTLKKGAFPVINIVPNEVGTVIAIGGKLEVAQEITALMTANYTYPATNGNPVSIGNISNILIDNKASFTSSSTSNSFKVKADGVYSVNMNLLIDTVGGTPVIGIWCDTDNKWVARINFGMNGATRANFTLVTAIAMNANKTYSFRSANTESTTVTAFSTGSTGTGPVAFYSVKRLK